MSRTYTCNQLFSYDGFSYDGRGIIKVYSKDDGEVIVFSVDDVAAFLGSEPQDVVRNLDFDEMLQADVLVGTDELGTHIVKQGCITECGLFHTCLNHMSPQVYSRKQNKRARELMRYVTHNIIPQMLADKEH